MDTSEGRRLTHRHQGSGTNLNGGGRSSPSLLPSYTRQTSNGNGLSIPSGGESSPVSSRSIRSSPRKRRHGGSHTDCCRMACLMLAMMMGGALVTGVYLFAIDSKTTVLAAANTELRELQRKLNIAEQDNDYLKDRLKQTQAAKADLEDHVQRHETDAKELAQLKHDKQYLEKYRTRLQTEISQYSKQKVLEKYGPGPFHVELTVSFVPHSPLYSETDNRIVLELAPLELMPHAVWWFLEQVTHGLYDGCSFHRNAGHVVQAGPAPNHLSDMTYADLNGRFRESGMSNILFQEYSPEFPHVKYTMGYAGRPGGPDIYISTHDNSQIHGPGGQTSYEDPEEADPCFAKVVEGFSVVDRMTQTEVRDGGYRHMKENVGIVSMKLLTESSQ